MRQTQTSPTVTGDSSGTWYDKIGPIGMVGAGAFCLILLVLLIWIVSTANSISEEVAALKREMEECGCEIAVEEQAGFLFVHYRLRVRQCVDRIR